MRKVTLVRGARQLLTLRGPSGPRRGTDLQSLGIIQDGAVLAVDGLVHEVGPSRRLENLALARGAEEIDASGCVVMPGFVDAHIHAVSGPARPQDGDLPQSADIALGIARTIQEHSPRALEAMALRVVEEAVRHGTTTFGLTSGFGLTVAGEAKILRVHSALRRRPISVASTYLSARVPPDYEARQDEYLQWIFVRLLPLLRRRALAEFVEIRCGDDSFTQTQACRFLTAGRRLGLLLKVHAGGGRNPGAVTLAVQSGAATVVPGTGTAEQEARLLAESQTMASLLPGPVFYLGTPCYPEARLLIDNGAAVALGTEYNPDTSPSPSMQAMIALACRAMRMTPAEAITAATINAAYALRRADTVGSLETGKCADLLILGTQDYRELARHFGTNAVDVVMKNGEVLVERAKVRWPVRAGSSDTRAIE